MATSALHPFLCFFHSQLVNCIFDNFPYPMPRMLITFPNVFIFGQHFMERFPIASASEQAVFCSLYYALLLSKGSPATLFQNCSSSLLNLIPWAKIKTSGWTLIDMSTIRRLFLSSVVSNLSWRFGWRSLTNSSLVSPLFQVLFVPESFVRQWC